MTSFRNMTVRIFLALVATSFALFGTISFIDPLGMASGLGVTVGGPNGAYELRGIYGGVSLSAAMLCLAGLLQPAMRAPALWFIVTYMGGYVAARAGALLLGPAPTSIYAGFVAFEIAVLAGAAWCLWSQRRSAR